MEEIVTSPHYHEETEDYRRLITHPRLGSPVQLLNQGASSLEEQHCSLSLAQAALRDKKDSNWKTLRESKVSVPWEQTGGVLWKLPENLLMFMK